MSGFDSHFRNYGTSYRFNENHPACTGGCGMLADECECRRPARYGAGRCAACGVAVKRMRNGSFFARCYRCARVSK